MIIHCCSLFSVIGPKTALKNEDYTFVIANNAGAAMDIQVTFGDLVQNIKTIPGQQREITMKVIILDLI